MTDDRSGRLAVMVSQVVHVHSSGPLISPGIGIRQSRRQYKPMTVLTSTVLTGRAREVKQRNIAAKRKGKWQEVFSKKVIIKRRQQRQEQGQLVEL